MKKNINGYWVIEFNEGENNYAGRMLDETLLDELKIKDQSIKDFNDSLLDEYGDLPKEHYEDYLGYYKFYFDYIIDGKAKEHFRIDIGDGNISNEKEFDYLYKQITSHTIKQWLLYIKGDIPFNI